jgi:hypothetical protein
MEMHAPCTLHYADLSDQPHALTLLPAKIKSLPLPEVDEFSEFSWQATQLVTGQVKVTQVDQSRNVRRDSRKAVVIQVQ